jgi:outer membrane murein-binding lipoprotein Lpp
MARKAVIRRLCKSLPLSVEMTAATQLLAGDESGESKSEAAAQVLEVDPDVRMLKATVEKPRPEVPAKRESVAEAKAKARQSAAAKPSPEPVKPDAGNRYRAAVAKLVAKGMTPEAAEDVATALFDGLESGAQHERVVAQSLREGLKVDVQDDAPEALLALIEGLS